MVFGGGQEQGFRPGTENTAMIVGLGVASQIVTQNLHTYHSKMMKLKKLLRLQLMASRLSRISYNSF